MSLRGLQVAAQFLTRLPVPPLEELSPRDRARAAWWYPLIGLAIGALLAAPVVALRHVGPLIAAALALAAWAWLTGAMHLDGLADLADALGAAHRDPQRFLAVLADPHIGAFGLVVTVIALLMKFAALAELPRPVLAGLVLVPAWARLGALAWSRWLPPLKSGRGAQLAAEAPAGAIVLWALILCAASVLVAPALLLAPLLILAFGVWLAARLGGMSGDCLGAGIELTEIALLFALCVPGVPALDLAAI
jgi:adenosylcobinamide-GDP ribazoletransferase